MLSKVLAVVALVVLPLSAGLWYASHHHPLQRRYDLTLYKSLAVFLKDGVCGMNIISMPTRTASRTSFESTLNYDARPQNRALMLTSRMSGPNRVTWLVFPLWLSTALLAVMGAWPIARGPARQWWRHYRGACLDCGYNLTGNRSGRCPECGSRILRQKNR